MEILEELWCGQLQPGEMATYRAKEYQELAELMARNEKDLLSTLTSGQQEALRKITDLFEEMESLSQCAAFIAGFRLAVQLMTAAG